MKAYLDTNVLVAASVLDHPHHARAFDLLNSIKAGNHQGYINTHGLAELYSVLTWAPFTPRIHPAEAGRFVEDNVLEHVELISLSAGDYKQVLRAASQAGVIGGSVFDMLHLHCAEKAKCARLYTFNVREFRTLAPAQWAERIVAP